MNPFIEMLKTRRSAPPMTLDGPPPTAEQIETLLTIASRVPDHGKLARFRFILFEGAAREKAGDIVADVFERKHHKADAKQIEQERMRLIYAPLVIGVVSRAGPHEKIPEWEQILTAGAVCMELVVAANAMGFATIWLTEWYAYDREVLNRLGVGANERMAGFVHIGHNDAPREDRLRPVLAEITTRFGG
jgi:nitroreductase